MAADDDLRPLIGRLKLRQMALLVALDLHRSLRRAAEAIAVTQPAATRLLRDLEQAFGAALFARHAWGMEPTAAGEALTRYARSLLTEAQVTQYQLEPERAAFVAELAARWVELARTPAAERRVALVLANYPARDGRIGNGVGLDTPASALEILKMPGDAVVGTPAE